MPLDGRGGVLIGTYLKLAGVYFAVHGLFLVQLVGGRGRGV